MHATQRLVSSRASATWAALLTLCTAGSLLGAPQQAAPEASASTNASQALPAVIVTARKAPASVQSLPLSVTPVTQLTLQQADIRSVKDASLYAPNTFLNEFSARALSNPFFRGIGGGPVNPGVTTYIDGVPQFNGYSSSLELLDVEQVEFVRGPQAALWGRNTAAGLITITSRRPASFWTGQAQASYGNYNATDVRASLSGPLLQDHLALSLAGGYGARDGFTLNERSGKDLDSRQGEFGKAQLLFQPSERFELRLIVSGERDRDGDYALGDLNFIRAHPHHVVRDFDDGYNHRDVTSSTLLGTYHGEAVELSSISGWVWWQNHGLTDLDYGVAALPNGGLFATRDNYERQNQFSQEVRLASAKEQPLTLSDSLQLSWQAGLFGFDRDYQQSAQNSLRSLLGFFPASLSRSDADLQDWGGGLYGQGTVTAWERLDLSAGLRVDYENKTASLHSSSAASTEPSEQFSEASPQFSLAYRFTPEQSLYASVARGYKAGGFNAPPTGVAAPAGTQTYGTEHTWNYEIGHKAQWLEGSLQTRLALFYVDWQSLQLNQQLPFGGGQYFIANAGRAESKGVEFEVKGRPLSWWELFGGVGYTDAHFLSGSSAFNANTSLNQDVSGKRLPFAPAYTANLGTEAHCSPCSAITLYARAQVTLYGDFDYDASNAQGQSTYSLAEVRAGLRGSHWFAEGWVNNAFDTHYVPIAIPYGQLGAPSGYVGESGAPLTFGVRAGLLF